MFVRFRQTTRRLQASLTKTHRQDGKMRHEHVAGLGSVPLSPSAADRIAFWTKLHQRLYALNNPGRSRSAGAILTAMHARIPMPTLDDQQAVQLERAQADARFWEALAEMHAEPTEATRNCWHRRLRASHWRLTSLRRRGPRKIAWRWWRRARPSSAFQRR
jgi:hypothetical protein